MASIGLTNQPTLKASCRLTFNLTNRICLLTVDGKIQEEEQPYRVNQQASQTLNLDQSSSLLMRNNQQTPSVSKQ